MTKKKKRKNKERRDFDLFLLSYHLRHSFLFELICYNQTHTINTFISVSENLIDIRHFEFISIIFDFICLKFKSFFVHFLFFSNKKFILRIEFKWCVRLHQSIENKSYDSVHPFKKIVFVLLLRGQSTVK